MFLKHRGTESTVFKKIPRSEILCVPLCLCVKKITTSRLAIGLIVGGLLAPHLNSDAHAFHNLGQEFGPELE